MLNKVTKKGVVLGSALVMLASSSLFAANSQANFSENSNAKLNKSGYLGVQGGYADLNYKKSWLTDDPNIISVGEVDDTGFAGRFFGGFNFNPYVALEIGYVVLPKVQFKDISVSGASTTVDESFNQNILDFMVKGTLPFKEGYDLYAKAGYAVVTRDELEATSDGATVKSDASDSKSVPVLGAGASYHITQHVITDVSFIYYFGRDDLEPTDFGSVGLIYQFG